MDSSVAELMLAEESWNPVDKLARFNAWQPVLDAAIKAMPGDLIWPCFDWASKPTFRPF